MQVFRSFAVDAVASMSSSCSAIADSCTPSERMHALLQLLSDSALSWLLISLNSLTMMTQAIIYSVALNSGKNELVALMIATSFMEVKVHASLPSLARISSLLAGLLHASITHGGLPRPRCLAVATEALLCSTLFIPWRLTVL